MQKLVNSLSLAWFSSLFLGSWVNVRVTRNTCSTTLRRLRSLLIVRGWFILIALTISRRILIITGISVVALALVIIAWSPSIGNSHCLLCEKCCLPCLFFIKRVMFRDVIIYSTSPSSSTESSSSSETTSITSVTSSSITTSILIATSISSVTSSEIRSGRVSASSIIIFSWRIS